AAAAPASAAPGAAYRRRGGLPAAGRHPPRAGPPRAARAPRGSAPTLCPPAPSRPAAIPAPPPPPRRRPQVPRPRLRHRTSPRRKLMLMASEAAIFTGILFAGTSLWPLSNVPVDLVHPDARHLRGLLTCFTIALICQTSLSYNELYDWKISQNRAELPNRLLH